MLYILFILYLKKKKKKLVFLQNKLQIKYLILLTQFLQNDILLVICLSFFLV